MAQQVKLPLIMLAFSMSASLRPGCSTSNSVPFYRPGKAVEDASGDWLGDCLKDLDETSSSWPLAWAWPNSSHLQE